VRMKAHVKDIAIDQKQFWKPSFGINFRSESLTILAVGSCISSYLRDRFNIWKTSKSIHTDRIF
jgi:hypothetical protein